MPHINAKHTHHLQAVPSLFQHPQTHRLVQLGDVVVGYALQRVRRRSVGLVVGPLGLTVRAPQWVTLSALDDAVRGKAAWVLRQLANSQNRQVQSQGQRVVWADGVVLPYMGQQLHVVLISPTVVADGDAFGAPSLALRKVGGKNARPQTVLLTPSAPDQPLILQVALPPDASAVQVRQAVQCWFMHIAQQHFEQRLNHFAGLLGVRWTSLHLSNAKTRWGSARIDGAIRLNWRLLHACPETIDYVVAHELAHLRFMNHSALFWDAVGSVFPDYRAARQRLRGVMTTMWDEPISI
jgi:predicted metal-dependent hydrolase